MNYVSYIITNDTEIGSTCNLKSKLLNQRERLEKKNETKTWGWKGGKEQDIQIMQFGLAPRRQLEYLIILHPVNCIIHISSHKMYTQVKLQELRVRMAMRQAKYAYTALQNSWSAGLSCKYNSKFGLHSMLPMPCGFFFTQDKLFPYSTNTLKTFHKAFSENWLLLGINLYSRSFITVYTKNVNCGNIHLQKETAFQGRAPLARQKIQPPRVNTKQAYIHGNILPASGRNAGIVRPVSKAG